MPRFPPNDISQDIRCPICQYTMTEATILFPSGHTYCFDCIFRYLQSNPNKDTILNIDFDHIDLVPNYTVRQMVEKLSNAIPAQIEENEDIIVEARILQNNSNQRDCKFGKNCKRRGCWFNHPEGQARILTIN